MATAPGLRHNGDGTATVQVTTTVPRLRRSVVYAMWRLASQAHRIDERLASAVLAVTPDLHTRITPGDTVLTFRARIEDGWLVLDRGRR